MHDASFLRRHARLLVTLVALLAGAWDAHGADTYLSGGHLAIPSLSIGRANYSDVVLTIGSIVNQPSGTAPNGTQDRYNPANNQLIVPAVEVGGTAYYNAVATVAGLTSIRSASGVDTFDGTHLHIPYVQVGGTIYSQVVLNVSLTDVVAVRSGMPGEPLDQYAAGQLTIPAVLVGTTVYTNVVLNLGLGSIVSVAGTVPAVWTGISDSVTNASSFPIYDSDFVTVQEYPVDSTHVYISGGSIGTDGSNTLSCGSKAAPAAVIDNGDGTRSINFPAGCTIAIAPSGRCFANIPVATVIATSTEMRFPGATYTWSAGCDNAVTTADPFTLHLD